MISDNIKNMTNEEVINLINKIVMEETEPELSDLKVILAEASGRKLEKNYINIIAERIKKKIEPEKAEPKRKPETIKNSEKKADNAKKVTFDDVYSQSEDDIYEEDESDEKYPVMSFLASLYRVFGWILFVGIIVGGIITSVLAFKEKIAFVCLTMLASILVAVIVLLVLLGISEKKLWKIDVERHLRNIASKK